MDLSKGADTMKKATKSRVGVLQKICAECERPFPAIMLEGELIPTLCSSCRPRLKDRDEDVGSCTEDEAYNRGEACGVEDVQKLLRIATPTSFSSVEEGGGIEATPIEFKRVGSIKGTQTGRVQSKVPNESAKPRSVGRDMSWRKTKASINCEECWTEYPADGSLYQKCPECAHEYIHPQAHGTHEEAFGVVCCPVCNRIFNKEVDDEKILFSHKAVCLCTDCFQFAKDRAQEILALIKEKGKIEPALCCGLCRKNVEACTCGEACGVEDLPRESQLEVATAIMHLHGKHVRLSDIRPTDNVEIKEGEIATVDASIRVGGNSLCEGCKVLVSNAESDPISGKVHCPKCREGLWKEPVILEDELDKAIDRAEAAEQRANNEEKRASGWSEKARIQAQQIGALEKDLVELATEKDDLWDMVGELRAELKAGHGLARIKEVEDANEKLQKEFVRALDDQNVRHANHVQRITQVNEVNFHRYRERNDTLVKKNKDLTESCDRYVECVNELQKSGDNVRAMYDEMVEKFMTVQAEYNILKMENEASKYHFTCGDCGGHMPKYMGDDKWACKTCNQAMVEGKVDNEGEPFWKHCGGCGNNYCAVENKCPSCGSTHWGRDTSREAEGE